MARPPERAGLKRPPVASGNYSKAFDNFLSGNDADIEGLVAYALYKRTVRDQCRQGLIVDGAQRDPPKSEVATYRSSAANLLEEMLTDYEEAVRVELQRSHFEDQVERWKGEIKATIRERTNVGGQIVVNIIAWAITLAISAAVFFAARASTIDEMVAERVDAELARRADQAVAPSS